MPVYAGGFLLKNSAVTVDDTEYANQVTKHRLVPDTPTASLRTCVPDGTIVDSDSTMWKWQVTVVAPKVLAGSLWKALFDAAIAGTTCDVVAQPAAGIGNAEATFTVTPLPGDFGGDQGSINTFDLELPVVGQPVFVDKVS